MQHALVQARKRGRNFIRLGSRTHWGNSAPGWNLKLHVHGTCRYFNNIIYDCASRASNSEPHMHAIKCVLFKTNGGLVAQANVLPHVRLCARAQQAWN